MARPVVVAVAALQIVLPLSLLGVRWADEGSRPKRELGASFQMYSAAPAAAYSGVDADGRERALSVQALPWLVRAIDVGASVPERLCDRHPDVLVVRRTGGPEPGDFRC